MKKLFFVITLLLISGYTFAFEKTDTTFSSDLNGDDNRENISISANENEGTITLKINDSKFIYVPISATEIQASVVKINNKKYILLSNIDYYGYESVLFSFSNRIDSIGSFWSLDKPEVNYKGIIKVNNWLGFWSADYEYILENNKLIEKYKDEYNLKEKFNENKIITKEKLFLHSGKMINSKGLYEINPNTEIFLIKADIRNNCKEEEGWREGCHWYLLKTKDGTEGWIMLKDFQDKVEGIPWAG